MKSSNSIASVEQKYGMTLRDLLIQMYGQKKNGAAVAAALGISVNTLYVWLLRCGLQQKTVLVDRVLTSEVKS